MPAPETTIADAIVEALNGHTFSQAFTAARTYEPLFELEDMDVLHVTVVPRQIVTTPESRGDKGVDADIDVAIMQRPATLSNATLDALAALATEIRDFLEAQLFRIPAADAAWIGTRHAPLWDPAHLRQWRQFSSLITLTYHATT